MTRLATRLIAVVVPAALLLPAAAHAEKVVTDDGVGDAKSLDVASEVFGEESDGPAFFDAPAETATDITRTAIAHGRTRMTVTVQFRGLVASSSQSVDMRIFTPDARFTLTAGRVGVDEDTYLHPDRVGETGERRPCRAVRSRWDEEADALTVSFPTTCIGTPPWVQLAVVGSRYAMTPQADGSVNLAAFADDAFRPGVRATSAGRSPKVRRG